VQCAYIMKLAKCMHYVLMRNCVMFAEKCGAVFMGWLWWWWWCWQFAFTGFRCGWWVWMWLSCLPDASAAHLRYQRRVGLKWRPLGKTERIVVIVMWIQHAITATALMEGKWDVLSPVFWKHYVLRRLSSILSGRDFYFLHRQSLKWHQLTAVTVEHFYF